MIESGLRCLCCFRLVYLKKKVNENNIIVLKNGNEHPDPLVKFVTKAMQLSMGINNLPPIQLKWININIIKHSDYVTRMCCIDITKNKNGEMVTRASKTGLVPVFTLKDLCTLKVNDDINVNFLP